MTFVDTHFGKSIGWSLKRHARRGLTESFSWEIFYEVRKEWLVGIPKDVTKAVCPFKILEIKSEFRHLTSEARN